MSLSFIVLLGIVAAAGVGQTPHAAHVTIVVMENRNYTSVAGNRHAPFFNDVLVPKGALLTNSHGVQHPSQPNYLDLFSGSNQGVENDSCPHAFASENIATLLAAKRLDFAGYAESMPTDGYTGCRAEGLYARKHVPWTNFTNVPSSESRAYTSFPANPPSLLWIVPNMCNDMHDCETSTGDNWLKANLPAMIAWNERHDGLLVLTWDESDFDLTNHIPTLLIGPMIRPGRYAQRIDHYNVLHTVETIFGLPCIKNECHAADITGMWR